VLPGYFASECRRAALLKGNKLKEKRVSRMVIEGADTSTDLPSFLSQKSYKFLRIQYQQVI
jgi:hypothetical protein